MKKLIIAGGSGFIGKELINYFKNDFDKIVILSRNKNRLEDKIAYINWDAKNFGDWCNELEGATAIINLTGKNINCRFTEENKTLILSSRVNSTKIIGEAILKCKTPPELWINASTADLYLKNDTTPANENSPVGSGFMTEVGLAWEKAMSPFNLPNTRKINFRISLVMGKTGGVFPVLLNLTKKMLGGTLGSGNQHVSWVHIEDFCGIAKWCITNKNARGAYNIVSPETITNKNFMQLLRKKTKVPFGLPAAAWMIKIGAFFIGTEAELILNSLNVAPTRLLNEGFKFKYNQMEDCVNDLLKK
jgi:uncharacterized protein (TIGR01777 family)